MIASNSDILNFLFDVESSRTVLLQAVTNEALRSDKSAWKPSGEVGVGSLWMTLTGDSCLFEAPKCVG